MEKKRVLHIIDSLEIGGAEKLLVKLVNELEKFTEVHLILLAKGNNPLAANLPASCTITIIPFKSILSLPKVVFGVKKYIKKNKINIVHTQLYWPGIISRLACSHKQKVINTIQAITSEATYKINYLTCRAIERSMFLFSGPFKQ